MLIHFTPHFLSKLLPFQCFFLTRHKMLYLCFCQQRFFRHCEYFCPPQVSLRETFRISHTSEHAPSSPGCSRHFLLAVGLVGWAGGHHGLLEALHTPLHRAAHVLAHHIGAPVPEERGRNKQDALTNNYQRDFFCLLEECRANIMIYGVLSDFYVKIKHPNSAVKLH